MQEMKYNEIDLETYTYDDEDFFSKKNVNTINDFNNLNDEITYNEIDMECNSYDEDDDSFNVIFEQDKDINLETNKNNGITYYNYFADFSDDEEESTINTKPSVIDEYTEEFTNEFTSEEILNEKKKNKKITQGEVEKDYWDKLSKKHAKTNVKGAYNTSFHFSADPEREAELFNNSFGIQNIETSLDSTESSVEAVCENKSKNKYQKLFEDLLLITGFEIEKDEDNNYIIKDLCNSLPNVKCSSKNEILNQLKPYIQDTFIFPLEITTGECFQDYKD